MALLGVECLPPTKKQGSESKFGKGMLLMEGSGSKMGFMATGVKGGWEESRDQSVRALKAMIRDMDFPFWGPILHIGLRS